MEADKLQSELANAYERQIKLELKIKKFESAIRVKDKIIDDLQNALKKNLSEWRLHMETKHWYQSLTMAGLALLTLCTVILPAFGLGGLAENLENEKANITEILNSLGAVIGLILAVIGRVRAKTKITT